MKTRFSLWRQQGSILIVVVGMLTLLLLLAISVGRKTNQELLLVQYSLQKMQARYLAWAGFHYTLSHLRDDNLDETSRLFDNQFACGIKLKDDMALEDIFNKVKMGDGWFSVYASPAQEHFGMSDVDGKINLNALNTQNYGILQELLMEFGLPDEDAKRIAAAVVDWRDEDTQPALGAGQEQEGPFGYGGKQFIAKNRAFDHVKELLWVNGITNDIYEKIKDLVTVFPKNSQGVRMNWATSPQNVLLATARYFTGSQTNTSREDADSMVKKVVMYRAGSDRMDGTADDQQLDENKIALTMPEKVLFRALNQFQTQTSRFLTFRVNGVAAGETRRSRIDAIVDRETLTVVSWRND